MKDVKSDKETWTQKAGDKIERLGDKISDTGAKKVGEAVHKAGDKLEHLHISKKNSAQKK